MISIIFSHRMTLSATTCYVNECVFVCALVHMPVSARMSTNENLFDVHTYPDFAQSQLWLEALTNLGSCFPMKPCSTYRGRNGFQLLVLLFLPKLSISPGELLSILRVSVSFLCLGDFFFKLNPMLFTEGQNRQKAISH